MCGERYSWRGTDALPQKRHYFVRVRYDTLVSFSLINSKKLKTKSTYPCISCVLTTFNKDVDDAVAAAAAAADDDDDDDDDDDLSIQQQIFEIQM